MFTEFYIRNLPYGAPTAKNEFYFTEVKIEHDALFFVDTHH